MDEFSVNRLSVMLDCDRQTLVRALKDMEPDGGTNRKPTFRVKTAVDALDRHRGKPDRRHKANNNGGGYSGGIPPALQAMYDRRDRLEVEMRALPDLEARREAARALIPITIETDLATRQNSLSLGHESDIVHLRADAILRLYARGIEGPTEWDHSTVWEMLMAAQGEGLDERE